MTWIAIGTLALLLPIGAAIWRIDNWQRDLTSNEAELSETAEDPLLRPFDFSGEPSDLAAIVESAASDLPRWELQERSDDAATISLHLTHKTALLGFIDDIHVAITPTKQGSRMTAQSKSRVGKADLGQNPRNLKELVKQVQALSADSNRSR